MVAKRTTQGAPCSTVERGTVRQDPRAAVLTQLGRAIERFEAIAARADERGNRRDATTARLYGGWVRRAYIAEARHD